MASEQDNIGWLIKRFEFGREKYGTIMQGNVYKHAAEEVADLYYYFFYIYWTTSGLPEKEITPELVAMEMMSANPTCVPQTIHDELQRYFKILKAFSAE